MLRFTILVGTLLSFVVPTADAQVFPQPNWNPGASWDTGRTFDQNGLGVQTPRAPETTKLTPNVTCPPGTRPLQGERSAALGDCVLMEGYAVPGYGYGYGYSPYVPYPQWIPTAPTARVPEQVERPLTLRVVPPAAPPVREMTTTQERALRDRLGVR